MNLHLAQRMQAARLDLRTGLLGIESLILPVGAALALGALILLVSASPAWLGVILVGTAGAARLFWSTSIPRSLLFAFMLTLPIDLSLTLISGGGIYTAGLALFLPDIFLIGMVAARVWGQIASPRKLEWDRTHGVVGLVLLWFWFSTLHSQAPLNGVLGAVIYTKFFVAYYLVSTLVKNPVDLRYVLMALFVGFVVQSIYIAAQTVTGSLLALQPSKISQVGVRLVFEGAGGLHAFRPAGLMLHPNELADYLSFILPVALGLFFLGKRRIGSRTWWAATYVLVAGGGALIITLSRSGWISLAAASLFVIATGLYTRLVPRFTVTALLVATMVSAAIVAFAYPQAYLRITQSDQRSTESRLVMIDQALVVIRNNPVLGVGLGAYNHAAQQNIPVSFSYISEYYQKELLKGIVHNQYLLLMSETGVIGLLLFIYMVWRIFRLAYPLGRWRDPVFLSLAISLAACIVGQTIFFAFDHFYADTRHYMLYVFFGLFHALVRIHDASYPPRMDI